MRTSPESVENAILQVFLELDIVPGAALTMRELQREWPRMRLRRSDLVLGVQRLVFSGELVLGHDGTEARLVLTAAGQHRARFIAGPLHGPWNRVASKVLHVFTRSDNPSTHNRRAGDASWAPPAA